MVSPKKTPRRLVLDGDVDTEALPLTLQHLLHQLSRTIPRCRHQLEGKRLAISVVADTVLHLGPAGLVQQQGCSLDVFFVFWNILEIDPIEGMDIAMGDRLLAFEQLLTHGIAIDALDQRFADADIGEDRVVEIEIRDARRSGRACRASGTARHGDFRRRAPGRW